MKLITQIITWKSQLQQKNKCMFQLLEPARLDNFYCLLYFNKLLKKYVGKSYKHK